MKKRVAVYISLSAALINAGATAQQAEISNREVTLSPQIREQTRQSPQPLCRRILFNSFCRTM